MLNTLSVVLMTARSYEIRHFGLEGLSTFTLLLHTLAAQAFSRKEEKLKLHLPFSEETMTAIEKSLMKYLCYIVISPSAFGELTTQMSLPGEVTNRFDLKCA